VLHKSINVGSFASPRPNPILPFTITARKSWEAKKSWDGFQTPKPFTRARVDIARPIYVPSDATDEVLEAKRDELQGALDQINQQGEEWRQAFSETPSPFGRGF